MTTSHEPTTQLEIYISSDTAYVRGQHRCETVAKADGRLKADLYLRTLRTTWTTRYGGKIMNDKMDDDSFRQFLREAFAAHDTVMKCGAVFYI